MPEACIPVEPAWFAGVAAFGLAAATALAALRPAGVVRRPRGVLACVLALTLAAAAALVRLEPLGLRLEIDASTEPLLPAGDPATPLYRQAVRDFGDDQLYVIAMEAPDAFTHGQLAALRRAGDAISRLEGVRSVRSLARATSFGYDPATGAVEIRPFVDEIPRDAASLARLRERALADPIYRRNLISDDGRTASLNVSFREMSDGEFLRARLDERIGEILAREAAPERRFHVSGRPHIKARMYDLMSRDLAVLIPAAIGVVGLVAALGSGTLRGVVLPLANVAVAIVWTFGAIALLARPLSILTVLLAPTLVAVGSVYGVHVVSRYEEEAAAGGSREEIVLRALRAMVVPVLISGATTVVGYAALLVTAIPAVFELAAFSLLGVGSVALLSLTAVPAWLVLLPLRPVERPGQRPSVRLRLTERLGTRLDAALGRLNRLCRRRSGRVLAIWAAVAAVALVAIPHIEVDTDTLSFFDAQSPVRRDFEAIDRLLAGAVPLYVVVESDEPGRLRDPEALARLDALAQRLAALPGVSRVSSFLDTLKRLHRALAEDDPAAERLPETRAGVAELLLLYPKAELGRFATVDQSAANLVVRSGAVGSAALRELAGRIEAVLAGGALPERTRAWLTGNALLLAHAADTLAANQTWTIGLTTLTIFLLLALGLRSPRLGLVAMVPNVVPVLIFFGTLGAGAAPLSLPTSLIGSVALGITIDDTAHFLVRYRAERFLGRSPEQALERCTVAVGRPIALASAMLVLGFLSVAASEFATLRQYGLLSAWTLAVCLVADLTLLPALLVRARV
jgi:predicted RND superfamily exporter protein